MLRNHKDTGTLSDTLDKPMEVHIISEGRVEDLGGESRRHPSSSIINQFSFIFGWVTRALCSHQSPCLGSVDPRDLVSDDAMERMEDMRGR